jgi:hypothetical protein
MVDFIFSDAPNIDTHPNLDFDINIVEDLNGIKLNNNKIDQRTLINILQYQMNFAIILKIQIVNVK